MYKEVMHMITRSIRAAKSKPGAVAPGHHQLRREPSRSNFLTVGTLKVPSLRRRVGQASRHGMVCHVCDTSCDMQVLIHACRNEQLQDLEFKGVFSERIRKEDKRDKVSIL